MSNLVIPDGGNIGSASDTDAVTIESNGNVGIGVNGSDSKLQVATTQFDPSLARTTASILVRSESGSTTGDGEYSGAITFGKIDSSRPFGSIAGVQIGSDADGGGLAFFTKNGTSTNDIVGEAMRIDSSGNLKFDSGYGAVATAYACRAWVNFNGTGTVAIRASGNVSSITDMGGLGKYTINFTTAMPDANYSVFGGCGTYSRVFAGGATPTASSCQMWVSISTTGALEDNTFMYAGFFR